MEVFCIPVNGVEGVGKYILYRPLIGIAFVGNRAMADLTLRALQEPQEQTTQESLPEALAFLRDIGFLAPDPPVNLEISSRLTTAVLLLTNRCQLRCIYCYAAAGDQPGQSLPVSYGKALIDYVCQQALEAGLPDYDLAIHGGGEPTFAWTTLKSLVAYARQKPLHARINLTTNAIWSPGMRDWILKNIDSLSISMDGSPATQDHQRPFVSGEKSSPIVSENLRALDEHNFPYGIRMTAISPFTQLPRDVEYLCTHTGCRSIQVEPAFNTARGQHIFPDGEQYQAFVEAFLQAFQIAKSYNCRFYYSGARPGVVTTTFCSAPYGALAVAPSGRLVACYEIANESHPLLSISSLGWVDDQGVHPDFTAHQHLHQLFAERRASCRDCFCYWSCAGDCYARAFLPQPDGHLYKSLRCDMNRLITARLLLGLIAEGDGVWRGGRPLPEMG